jgi:hypothetical protein
MTLELTRQQPFRVRRSREPQVPTLLRSSGRDDKGRRVAQVGVVAGWEETGPATPLLGKDLRESQRTLQIPPVGRDDKGRRVAQFGVCGMGETSPATALLRKDASEASDLVQNRRLSRVLLFERK